MTRHSIKIGLKQRFYNHCREAKINLYIHVELFPADAKGAIEEKTEVQSKQRVSGKHEKRHGFKPAFSKCFPGAGYMKVGGGLGSEGRIRQNGCYALKSTCTILS